MGIVSDPRKAAVGDLVPWGAMPFSGPRAEMAEPWEPGNWLIEPADLIAPPAPPPVRIFQRVFLPHRRRAHFWERVS